jgi:uncharacterized membrane protein
MRGADVVSRQKIEYPAVFSLGGILYGMIEILWRGRTHWTMVLAGGCCFVMLYALQKYAAWPFWGKCAYGAAFITCVEFQFGCVVNRILGWGVWDYSALLGNWMGQICPYFTVLWFLLCIPALWLAKWLQKAAFSENRRSSF